MTMIKRILCPVDFSEASQHAIEHAVAIARWSKASVSALHVYRPSEDPAPSCSYLMRACLQLRRPQLRPDTAAWVEAARPHGVAVDVVFRTGQPVHEILDVATSLPADMIVMGTHGASGFEHLVLGSVTEKVLRKAGCPVMTIPPRAHATSVLPFRQLLCAIDFSESSLAGLDLAVSLAQDAGAGLTILHVIEWPWEEPPPPVLDELPPDQAATLAEFRRYLTTSATGRLKGLVPEARLGSMQDCAAGRSREDVCPDPAHCRRGSRRSHRHGRPRPESCRPDAVRLDNESGGSPRDLSGADTAALSRTSGEVLHLGAAVDDPPRGA